MGEEEQVMCRTRDILSRPSGTVMNLLQVYDVQTVGDSR